MIPEQWICSFPSCSWKGVSTAAFLSHHCVLLFGGQITCLSSFLIKRCQRTTWKKTNLYLNQTQILRYCILSLMSVIGWNVPLLPAPLQNSYVGVLTCSASECDLTRRRDLFRGNHVKMTSAGLALTQHTWCPYKNKCGDTYTERTPCEHTGKDSHL